MRETERISAVPASRREGERFSISGTNRFVLIEAVAAVRPPPRGRWVVALLAIAVVASVVFAVREMARIERALAAEGAKAVRVVVYEMKPGQELRVPVEARTDVFRIVVHAVRVGAPIDREPHAVSLDLSMRGERGSRSETLSLAAPGSIDRVTAEDRELSAGDPIGVNVDAHGIGAGEMTLRLGSVARADSLLVRVYRREALDPGDILRRRAHVDDDRGERLARRAGEIDWIDLDDDEREALTAARWLKVAASNAGSDVRVRAIALAPQHASARTHDLPSIGTFATSADRHVAVVAHGAVTVAARASEAAADIVAAIVDEDGSTRVEHGTGSIAIDVAAGRVESIDLSTSAHELHVVASDPRLVESPSRVATWRSNAARPVVVEAGSDPLVLRVAARRAVPVGDDSPATVALEATIAAPGAPEQKSSLAQAVVRSRYDRYDGANDRYAPTERAFYHLVVPSGARATLTPNDGELDLSLAELDPRAPPRPAETRPAGRDEARVVELGAAEWEGFVARRPSNLETFGPDARGFVRVAHRFVVLPPRAAAPSSAVVHVARPQTQKALRMHHRTFVPAGASIAIDVPAGRPLVLPMRVFSKEHADVVAQIDGERPKRRASGAAVRVTTSRSISVDGEVRTAIVLGDDLAPGRHVVTLVAPPGKSVWFSAPWVRGAGTRAKASQTRWVTGDFE